MYSIDGPWTMDFAVDVSNLTNERVYDVLGVQRPGRAALRLTVGWTDAAAQNAVSPPELDVGDPAL